MALQYFTALVGGTLIGLGVTVCPADVHAKPYRVRIDSTPSGATVYLDSKDREPLGQTPFRGKLPAGSHTIIVELDGYVSQVQDITIRKHRRVQRVAVKLSKIDLATLEVVAGKTRSGREMELRGARVLVDGRNVGTLPDTIQVPAGPHQIEVIMEGYKTFETWVEAAEGERVTVTAELVPVSPGRESLVAGGVEMPADGDVDDSEDRPDRAAMAGAGEEEDAPDELIDRDASDPAAARAVPYVTAGIGFEVAGRNFRPNVDQSATLRDYKAGGVLLARLTAEVNPLAFSPNKLLSGWGLYGSYARAAPLDSDANLMEETVQVPTEWNELDVGVSYRYRFAAGSFAGAQAGYGTHTFTFDFDARTEPLAESVPDVSYRFLRFGLEGRYAFGRFAALASGGTRRVNSIGNLADRFANTDIVAVNGGLGVAAAVTRSIEARLVGHYDRYSHTYTRQPGSPTDTPTSGVDQYYGATLSAVFSY